MSSISFNSASVFIVVSIRLQFLWPFYCQFYPYNFVLLQDLLQLNIYALACVRVRFKCFTYKKREALMLFLNGIFIANKQPQIRNSGFPFGKTYHMVLCISKYPQCFTSSDKHWGGKINMLIYY